MSKIEVNTIEPQCGTTVTVGKCTSTVAVPGNVVKSNALQASDGGNIVSQCGTDITLGASGDTIALACGASQTGFGRTGTVDWATAIKTTGFTAVSGEGYFCNTTSAGFTVTFPAASVGNIISISDYGSTFGSNALVVSPDGTDKIGGVNGPGVLNTDGQSVTFIYADATKGWLIVQDSTETVTGGTLVVASGGTVTTCGDYKIHTFTGPGTFGVAQLSPSAPENAVDWMVVAGGGGGGACTEGTGGGGAGGFRESPGTATGSYSVSPRGAAPSAAITVTVSNYPIAVGAGGAGGTPCGITPGVNGSVSTFSTYTSDGGGGGASESPTRNGSTGGSGGGGANGGGSAGSGGAGNTPPVSPVQGTCGGNGNPTTTPPTNRSGGGGGGAIASGVAGSNCQGGPGGGGATTSINGTATGYSGGGGGGTGGATGGRATSGGGAGGGPPLCAGGNGTSNLGGGAGGSSGGGLTGGSGVVILRYKYQ